MPTKVLVLYNQPTLPENSPIAYSEHEILYTADEVVKQLGAAGYLVASLGAGRDPESLLNGLREHRPDVVFNLFEGFAEHGQSEAYAAGILHWLGLPFTGSPFDTLTLARNKHLTKHLLRGAGLPTADFFVVDQLPVPPCRLEWPVIVKPALQDASVGLDQGSVVTDQPSLEGRVARLLAAYGPPVLVEQFIPGRELIVGLVEAPALRPLPVAEITFAENKPGSWPIVTFDAKWNPGTDDYESTPPQYPAAVSPRLAERVQDLALQAYQLLGCRDYARVDFRVRPPGKPYILEMNPNPGFGPEAGMAAALQLAGITHAQFSAQLIRNALERSAGGRQPPVNGRRRKAGRVKQTAGS